jgi:hypothetical protein
MIRRRGLQQVIRNSILLATLIGHMLSLFGLPAFITRVGWHKDLRVPFPCMYRPCGCKNAEDCWHNCCCLSLAERIAWAKQYNPPMIQGLSPTLDSQSCGSNTLAEPCCEANSCAQAMNTGARNAVVKMFGTITFATMRKRSHSLPKIANGCILSCENVVKAKETN